MDVWHYLINIFNQEVSESIQPIDLVDAAWLAVQWGHFDEDSARLDRKKSIEPTSPIPSANQEVENQEPLPEQLEPPLDNIFDEGNVDDQPRDDSDDYFDLQFPQEAQKNQPRMVCPAPPALTHQDKLAKAFRPFHQHVPSRFRTVIDERATVESIAEQNCWEPVLRWESERRFEVALVVEKSIAMGFWHNVVTELKQLLTRKGVFRDVRVWSLRKGQSRLEILPGLNPQTSGWRNPSSIVEPTGRRFILLISDCVSEGWYDGSIAKQIVKWSRYMPVALLQMLPEKLWQRTGLGTAIPIQLLPRSVGIQSIPFKAESSFMLDEEQLDDGALLPIAIIEPWPLEQLAGLITGVSAQGAPGFYLPN